MQATSTFPTAATAMYFNPLVAQRGPKIYADASTRLASSAAQAYQAIVRDNAAQAATSSRPASQPEAAAQLASTSGPALFSTTVAEARATLVIAIKEGHARSARASH